MTRSRKMVAALLAGLTMLPVVATTGIGTAEAAYRGRAYVGPRGGVWARPGYVYGRRRGYWGPGAVAAGVVGGLALGAVAAGAYGGYPYYGYGYPYYGGGSCIANQPVYDSWGNFIGYHRVYVHC